MGVVFIASLFEMMDLQCKVYFNRDNMPSDKLVMNHSDVGIFPEDNIIFINIENIDDPTLFYFLLSKCAYELKHNKNVPLVEINKRSDIFANYIIGLVFGAQIALNKDEETERILVEIEDEYPFQKVQPIIEQVEYEMEMLSEYDEEDSNTTLVICKGTNSSLMTLDDAMQEIYNTLLAHRNDIEGFDEYLEDNPHATFKDFANYRTDCYEEEMLNGYAIELYGIVYQTIEFKNE